MNREQAEMCDKLITYMEREDQYSNVMDINLAKKALDTEDNEVAFLIMKLVASHKEIVNARHFKGEYGIMLLPNEIELTQFLANGGFVALYDRADELAKKEEEKEQRETSRSHLEETLLKKQVKSYWVNTWGAFWLAVAALVWQIVDSCNK